MKDTIIQYKKPLLAGGLLALILLGYFFRDKWMGWFKEDAPEETSPKETSSNPSPSTTTTGNDTILKVGSKGALVKELQIMLNKALKDGGPTLLPYLVEDGIFGAKTEARLMHFTNKKSISINQLIAELAKKS